MLFVVFLLFMFVRFVFVPCNSYWSYCYLYRKVASGRNTLSSDGSILVRMASNSEVRVLDSSTYFSLLTTMSGRVFPVTRMLLTAMECSHRIIEQQVYHRNEVVPIRREKAQQVTHHKYSSTASTSLWASFAGLSPATIMGIGRVVRLQKAFC